MNLYGSKIWYDARNNEDKIAINMFSDSVSTFTDLLEKSDLNYYGYDNGKVCKISINRDDLEIVKSLVGDSVAKSMKIEELAKPYTPPEKNVFGTIDYKYIARNSKRYISGESELERKAVLRTAELLSRQGVKFSGRAYDNKVTLTLNEQDLGKATEIYNSVLANLQEITGKIEQAKLNEKLSEIKNVFEEVGFTQAQIKAVQPLVREFTAFENVDIYDYVAQLDPEYTFEQNADLVIRLKDIYDNGGIDYMQPSDKLMALFEIKKDYNLDIRLRSYLSEHEYNEEQVKVIRDIVNKERSVVGVLGGIDETFKPWEIEHLYSLYRQGVDDRLDMNAINNFFDNHMMRQYQRPPYEDAFFIDNEREAVTWIYRNPDAESGDQFVTNEFSYKELLLASEFTSTPEEFFDYIGQSCKQYLSDYGTEYYEEALAEFNGIPAFTDCTADTLEKLVSTAKNDEKLEFFGKWEFAAVLIDKFTNDRELREIYIENKDTFRDEIKQRINKFADELLSNRERIQGYSRYDIMQFITEYKHSRYAENVRSEVENAVTTDIETAFEAIENAKSQAKELDTPFVDKFVDDEYEFDPYVYDGSMTPEDFEKAQELVLNEEEEDNDSKIKELYNALDEHREIYLSEKRDSVDINGYPVINAREKNFTNYRIVFEKDKGNLLKADSDTEKDLVLHNFTMVGNDLILDYLNSEGFEVVGFSPGSEQIENEVANDNQIENQKVENTISEPIADKSQDEIHNVAVTFGADEQLLRELINLNPNERSLNEFGRFNKLYETVDTAKAREYFENEENSNLSQIKVNAKLNKFLRDFILNYNEPAQKAAEQQEVESTEEKPTQEPVKIEQIQENSQLDMFGETQPAEKINQDMIDYVLKCGSNDTYTLERIVAQFQKGKSTAENAEYLRNEFDVDGRGYEYTSADGADTRLSAWFDKDGLRIAEGVTARNDTGVLLSWEQVAERIGELLENGEYTSQEIIDRAADYETENIAAGLWNLHHDCTIEFFIPDDMFKGGYPDSVARIAESFTDKDVLQGYIDGLTDFIDRYEENRDILHFHYHKPKELLSRLKDLQTEHRSFVAKSDFSFEPKYFITEDEKEKLLSNGSNFSGGKFRIAEYFGQEHTQKEKAEFLKQEYGIGGMGYSGIDVQYDAKGIVYRKGDLFTPDCSVTLNWNQAVKIIDKLVSENRYLTQEDIEKRNRYQQENEVQATEKAETELSETVPEEPTEQSDEVIESAEEKTAENIAKEPTVTVSTVTVLGSEHPRLVENKTYTLAEFDGIIEQLNYEWISNRQKEIKDYGSIDDAVNFGGNYQSFARTDFVINLPSGEEIPESINIGSDYGGLIDYLKTVDKYTDLIPKLEQAVDNELAGKTQEYEQLSLTVEERPSSAENVPQNEEKQRAETVTSSVPVESSDTGKAKSFERKLSAEPTEKTAEPTEEAPRIDYHITDNHIGEGTKSERFKNNIAAIRTLKQIESENRLATAEEQVILAKYVGWGGLSECFNEKHTNYNQLRHYLTDDEFRAARASTMTAFYTSPVVMKSMYKALGNMGFEKGEILEPSCGVGNFLGTLPESMQGSNIHAVELDSISGRIAKQLYQTADIKITGFEKTRFNDGAFDVAVGNVPFGEIKVSDKQYDKYNWKIHNYFFAKSLDKVRPGGVVAFLTSRYTLDSKSSAFREYLSERADLLGAIRLPNNTFSKAAGTQVVSDIIFLQKRDTPPEITPDWVQTAENENGFTVNKYFADNPDMILGNLAECSSAFGRPDVTVKPIEGAGLEEQLDKVIENIKGTIPERTPEEREIFVEAARSENSLTVPEDLRNLSFYVNSVDNKVYFKKDDDGFLWKKGIESETYAERAKAFIELRDSTRAVLDAMVNNCSDEELHSLQSKLNTLYDSFYKKYGLVHSKYNKSLFREDISYQLVSSLESKYDEKSIVEKSDLFTKRTIKPPVLVTSVDTAQEALTVSLAERGRVDLDFMAELYGNDKEFIINELKGKIYPVPELSDDENIVYQDLSEYLSGDIRKKIEKAKEAAETNPTLYAGNIKALENVLPEPLKAGDIDVKLGATWIDPIYYQQFMYEVFKTPNDNRADKNTIWRRSPKVELSYSELGNSYHIDNKSIDMSVFATKTYGTKHSRANAYYIYENLLNLRETKIYRTETDIYGNERRVVDVEKTKVAASKAEKIKKEFKEWIFKDPKRRETLVKKYNDMYNSIRPREYDGSGLTFPGMNAEITLRPHQKNAIAHALYGGNTLFAHSVGAGKTYEMIATAMESKRLGLCNKSLIVVPNHLTEQIGADFQKLYPNANVLLATKADFTKENRRYLVSRIATGDYDAVIIGHSQLGKIPLSKEKQKEYIQEEIDELVDAIAEMKASDEQSFSIKDAEKRKDDLEKKLEALETKKEEVVTFEELGIDKIFVDEAHEFKNLYTPTKLNNVSGVSHTASQKASDLYMKCRYLDEKTGNRGVTFATGTPISNSVTELYTMQRYLQHDLLQEKHISHFDQWIGLFGEQVTDYQIDPTGKKFKQKIRIAEYTNMPELMSMFNCTADIKTAEMMNLDVPECEMHVVNVEPTQLQQDLVNELSVRADRVENGKVEPEEDNFLKITSDGRKVGLDPRLIDPNLEDNPNTKLNQCVRNVLQIHKDTAEEKLTQLIFCDLGVPKNSSKAVKGAEDTENVSVAEQESFEDSGNFCIYDDIKKKLIDGGIPANEIAFIHDAKTDKAKAELFEKCRKGKVRVLLGSTPKMGTGTNIQDRLVALHDLDVPWRPADLEQRLGRMVRQGNLNKNVHLYRYVTKGTFDAYSYQTLENKQKYISQIYTNKNQRTCQDVDQQSLSYAEIKTLCTGDERLKELMVLDNKVSNLTAMKRDYTNTVYEMQDKITKFAEMKSIYENNISGIEKDIKICSSLPRDSETGGYAFELNVGGRTYTDKTKAGKALEQVCENAMSEITKGGTVNIGTMHGFPITLRFSPTTDKLMATVSGSAKYSIEFSAVSQPTNIKRFCNVFDGLEQHLAEKKTDLARLEVEVQEAEKIVATPFEREQELVDKTKRRNTLKNELQTEAASRADSNKGKSTYYFSLANLHKNAQKCKEQGKNKDKKKEKKQGVGSDGDGSI